MVLLATRLTTSAKRKIAYVIAGVAGPFFLTVIRVFLIAYYGYLYATSGADLEAVYTLGRSTIGERLFPLWILAFTVIIRNIENRLSTASVKPSDADRSVRFIEV